MEQHVYERDGEVQARLLGNALLVEIDEYQAQTASGIIFASGAMTDAHNTGRVVAVGFIHPKKGFEKVPIPGLKQGDRVLFVRFHAEHGHNKQMMEVLGRKVIFIRPADVILVFDDEDHPRMRPDLVAV